MKNFGFKHKTGILLSISSLPSDYGIGNFGRTAYEFIDFLEKAKQKCWQVLPLNPTSYGDSPYQSPSSFAGNPYYIDLETLYEEELLTLAELNNNKKEEGPVDYGWLFSTRYDVLRKAFSRFAPNQNYYDFVDKHKNWINDYALFMSLKVKHNFQEWTKWDKKYRDIKYAKRFVESFSSEMNFWIFLQFKFFEQWEKLLEYAHQKGIVIIGDMPIYVALDSVDVWKDPQQFLLDADLNPTVVAGCPPDGFTPDGQLWGNPIYDWKLMEEQDFGWWCNRLEHSFKMYDILRIDHFRGFAGFYTIPFGHKNAKEGKWNSAPGIKLFRTINKKYPNAKIIAEDLGFITDDVRELLEDTGFPGMKILQFAFYDDDSEYLPRMFSSENYIVYTGSHDSDCTVSWFDNLDENALLRFKKEVKQNDQEIVDVLIELALNSKANLSIIPIQDYLGLNNEEGRMNTPSTSRGNWIWRLEPNYCTSELINKIRNITIKSNRY